MKKIFMTLLPIVCISLLMNTLALGKKADNQPDTSRIMKAVQHLTREIGPRPAGNENYIKAMEFIWDTMSTQGYDGNYQSYRTPGNQTARNLDFLNAGTQNKELILAAPVDSEPDSTGAASSASAVALLLEMAKIIRDNPYAENIHFLFLGAELDQYGYEEGRYFGSSQFAAYQKKLGINFLNGVIYLNNPGGEGKLVIKKAAGTSSLLSDRIIQIAQRLNIACELKEVPRWQPMLPFEDAGISTVWLERVPEKETKQRKKSEEKVSSQNLEETARLLMEVIQSGI